MKDKICHERQLVRPCCAMVGLLQRRRFEIFIVPGTIDIESQILGSADCLGLSVQPWQALV